MSDSDDSPQQDNHQNRRPRTRSPVSPGCAGETLAEREERRLGRWRCRSGRLPDSPGQPLPTPGR